MDRTRVVVSVVLLASLPACVSHTRGAIGGTYGGHARGLGAEAIAESATGDDDAKLVGALTANVDHESGGALLVGAELGSQPMPWGGRFTALVGPRFQPDSSGEFHATGEFRGSFVLEHGLERVEDSDGSRFKTIGIELFVSKIGVGSADAFAGIGVTFGTYHIPATGGVMD